MAATFIAEPERLAGAAALGVGFDSGHLLALRHITASSIGPPFASVCHRSPDGVWTLYINVEPGRSCARYLGAAVDRTVVTDVTVAWTGDAALSVSAPAVRLDWSLRLATPPAARLVGVAFTLLAPAMRASPHALEGLGRAAARLLGIAPPALTGRAPNGQRFVTAPRKMWRVAGSAAVVDGHDAGSPVASITTSLGSVPVPSDGAFLLAETTYDAFDASRHRTATATGGVTRR